MDLGRDTAAMTAPDVEAAVLAAEAAEILHQAQALEGTFAPARRS